MAVTARFTVPGIMTTTQESNGVSVIVSNTPLYPAVAGTYTARGAEGGKPYYNLVGQPDSVINSVILWDVGNVWWQINASDGSVTYADGDATNCDFPWEVPAWQSPLEPTVTQG